MGRSAGGGGEDVTVVLDPSDEARLLHDVKAFSGELSKALTKRLRAAAEPTSRLVVAEVAAQIPRRGGLAYRVAGARGTVSTRTGAQIAGVTLGYRKPRVLREIERGKIPHPVYAQGGRPGWRWVTQPIRAGMVTQAFKRNEALAREAVREAVLDAAKTIQSGKAKA